MQVTNWHSLSAEERGNNLRRPVQGDADGVADTVKAIVAQVRREGDAALAVLTEQFDAARVACLRVTEQEFAAADQTLDSAQHAAIEKAITTVRCFHAAQAQAPLRVETAPGVVCERLIVPIGAVGLYVPAGSAPLPSSAIMLAVPAAIAGCPTRVICTPPGPNGSAHPAILVAARKAGIDQVFKVGGAQAIAAMAYGTVTIPKCNKIFGPGNAWVTAAKLLVAQDPGGAAADLPAGPSEVLVIADDSARPEFVAADLLAQAEHSAEAHAILLTPSMALAARVAQEITRQLAGLSRSAIFDRSLQALRLLVVDSLQTAFAIANEYAPEHLLLEIDEPRRWLKEVTAAGAVFLGHWSPESLGDYCSGPNHTLPTYGYARAYSGLSTEDFQKRITVQEVTREGLKLLAPTARVMAGLEGLDAHAAAVSVRLEIEK